MTVLDYDLIQYVFLGASCAGAFILGFSIVSSF